MNVIRFPVLAMLALGLLMAGFSACGDDVVRPDAGVPVTHPVLVTVKSEIDAVAQVQVRVQVAGVTRFDDTSTYGERQVVNRGAVAYASPGERVLVYVESPAVGQYSLVELTMGLDGLRCTVPVYRASAPVMVSVTCSD